MNKKQYSIKIIENHNKPCASFTYSAMCEMGCSLNYYCHYNRKKYKNNESPEFFKKRTLAAIEWLKNKGHLVEGNEVDDKIKSIFFDDLL